MIENCVYCKSAIKENERKVVVDHDKEGKPSAYAHKRCFVAQFLKLNANLNVTINFADLVDMPEYLQDLLLSVQQIIE